jgi:Short C-terminal domain
MPRRTVSPERKMAYYFGMGLTIVGVILFFSTAVSGINNFGNFSNFDGRVKSEASRAFGGFVCIFIGQIIMHIGRGGVAGSGLKLDPQEARRDLEPWSRMSGGMLKDTLDEAGINLSGGPREMPFDEQLRRLDALKRDGLITDAEYAAGKAKILQNVGDGPQGTS